MNENLIHSLRETQRLLDGRLDEINTLAGVMNILTPGVEKPVFCQEFSELLFSRQSVHLVSFFSKKGKKLLFDWKFGRYDNFPTSETKESVPEKAFDALKKRSVIMPENSSVEIKTVYIPIVFGDRIFGVMTLGFSPDIHISLFSRSFYFLLGIYVAVSFSMIEEWEKLTSQTKKLSKENKELREVIEGLAGENENFIFRSDEMGRVIEKVNRVKDIDVDVLFLGESGTGKELLTRYLHNAGKRSKAPFVAVNCAAIPENLVEGELFGITDGVATGVSARKGKFQQAEGGTIFLDEIGELPLNIQSKLLRLLQERSVTPIGDSNEYELDIRIVAATNRDLNEMVSSGEFRKDLFYRLNSFPVTIPPLRERKEDIYPLFVYFMKFFCDKFEKTSIKASESIEKILTTYAWPGNVRELKNKVRQAVIMSEAGENIDGSKLGIESFSENKHTFSPSLEKDTGTLQEKLKNPSEWLKKTIEKAEKTAIKIALEKSDGKRKKAAEMLDISQRALFYKMKKFRIN